MTHHDDRKTRSALGLLAGNAWRAANVVMSRHLGRPPRFLPVALLFVTDRCNLRCRMCGVCERERRSSEEAELTCGQWCDVIAAAADKLGTSIISISGGEPLLRKDIFDIIRFAADKQVSVHICTNAVLLNDVRVEGLRDSGVSTVSVSVDAPDAPTHDYLRGEHAFDATVRAIRLLHERAPQVQIGINHLITRHNYRKMADMVAFAEELGVQQLKFAPIHTNLLHRHKPSEYFQDLAFEKEDLADLEHEVRRAKQACAKSRLSTTSPAFFDGISRYYHTHQYFRCHAGYAVCAIGPTGEVAPCCDMDSKFSVKDRSLDEIWRDPAFHLLRKQVHHCRAACWDTTNTELSLRLRPWALLRNLPRNWRDLRFYSGPGGKSGQA